MGRTVLGSAAGAALLLSLSACDMDITFDGFCPDACPSGAPGPSTFVIGFPEAGVDRSATGPGGGYVGRVKPGDTFDLHVVRGESLVPPSALDTLRAVAWGVTDPQVASITSTPSGRGTFVATAAGTTRVTADGAPHDLWACLQDGCLRVEEIVVAP